MIWSEFNAQLDQVLKDSAYSQFPLELRMNAYNWAIMNLVNFEPNQKTASLASGSMSYDLPSDFQEVVAIWDGNNWSNGINFTSDSWTSMPNPIQENLNYERSFWIFANKLGFTKKLTNNGVLYYHGQYAKVSALNNTLDIPERTIQAILYWTVAGCLNPKIVQQGKVAIWGKSNQPGLTSKSMTDTYLFYWNEGIKILKEITHQPHEMTLIDDTRKRNTS